MMTTRLRRLALTAHIATSVGWIGAVAAFLALAIEGLTSNDVSMTRVTYPAMGLIARCIIVPLAFASLLSGLVQSLGTAWGLFRHYWIVVKLLLTTFATVVLLLKMPLIRFAARESTQPLLSSAALYKAGTQLAVHAGGGIVVLLVVTTLSVFKPWGLTRYGKNRQRARISSADQLRISEQLN